jgi:hypothetical protein
MALEDLSEHELAIGCRRVLRTWNYIVMPPPAYIRQAVAAALEEESRLKPPQREPDLPRLTLEEAWEDWEEISRVEREAREALGILAKKMSVVVANPERLRELQQQKKTLEGKYGKGPTVRVRDSAPPEANKGASGSERGPEESPSSSPETRPGSDKG